MAVRGWGGSVATAIGVAAGAGAAQLGLGYGLGIIAWLPSADGTSEAAWVASLTWAVWIAATSTVAGALCAHRLSGVGRRSAGPDGPPPTLASGLWRAALAVSSAIGGLVTVVLVAVPARAAVRADTLSPQTIAAGYAVIGVMIGLLVAIWAISSPAVATNVLGTVGWLWSLAVVAVVNGVLSGRGLASAQLGVWQLTSGSDRFWFRDYFYWPGAALSLGSALLIGVFAARAAARRPAARVGAAISGISGPLLVAVAYFLAAPRLVGIRAEQVSAHLMAPYAVIAGLAGSALVAALAQRSEALAQLGASRTTRSEPLEAGPEALAPGSALPGQPYGTSAERSAGADAVPTDSASAGADAVPTDSDFGQPADSDFGQPGDSDFGQPGDSGRPARVPAQPVGGSWRTTDDGDPFPARLADEPTAPSRRDERGRGRGRGRSKRAPEAGNGSDLTSDSPPDSAPNSTPDLAATGNATAGNATPTSAGETSGEASEGGLRGRFGRFGRRSR